MTGARASPRRITPGSWTTAHQQLGGPLVVVWDGLNTRVSHAMADLVAVRDWLTVFRLPPYAHELNPVESVRVAPEEVPGQPG
jgi:hypothetical protein